MPLFIKVVNMVILRTPQVLHLKPTPITVCAKLSNVYVLDVTLHHIVGINIITLCYLLSASVGTK